MQIIQDCTSPSIASGNTIQDNTDCGIYYQGSSSLGTIDNLTLTGNEGYGAFRMANSGDFILGAGNIISGNDWPLTTDPGSFPDPGSAIPSSGNTNDNIRVTSGTGTKTGTWPSFTGLNYIVTESPTIGSEGSLTIADGNTVRFNSGRYLSVYGTLNAAGTGSILFTSNDGGEWSGLRFYSGSSGDLDYCTAEYSTYGVYAGSPPFRLPFS